MSLTQLLADHGYLAVFVREIAMSCGAQVQLRDRPGGIDGLLVSVAFASSH